MNELVDVFEGESRFCDVGRLTGGQAYRQLCAVSAQLVDIQERERTCIAAELHDGIGQSLSIIKFGVEDALRALPKGNADATRAVLDELNGKVRRAIDEVRQMTTDLRPSILDDFGIVATMAWFVREFQEANRGIVVRHEICIAEQDVPAALKTTLYRILQEAMNNIARHAAKAEIHIYFGIEGQTIELSIEDYAAGFDVTRVMARTGCDGGEKRGRGLIGLHDRVLVSGGDCRIVFREGLGTLIRAAWPLR